MTSESSSHESTGSEGEAVEVVDLYPAKRDESDSEKDACSGRETDDENSEAGRSVFAAGLGMMNVKKGK